MRLDGFDLMMIWLTLGVVLCAVACTLQFDSIPLGCTVLGVYCICIALMYFHALADDGESDKKKAEKEWEGFR